MGFRLHVVESHGLPLDTAAPDPLPHKSAFCLQRGSCCMTRSEGGVLPPGLTLTHVSSDWSLPWGYYIPA